MENKKKKMILEMKEVIKTNFILNDVTVKRTLYCVAHFSNVGLLEYALLCIFYFFFAEPTIF